LLTAFDCRADLLFEEVSQVFAQKLSFFGNGPVAPHDSLNEGSLTALQCRTLSINNSPLQFARQRITSSAHVLLTIFALVSVAAITGSGFQLSGATTKALGHGAQTLTVTPGSLAFNPVAVGGRSSKLLTLSNTGSTTLTVSALKVSGSGFTVTGGTFPMSIARNTSVTLQAVFAPTRGGSANGLIEIDSNSNTNRVLLLGLSGSGTASSTTTPQLSVTSGSLDFGSVALSSTGTQTLTLSSTGTAAVVVNSVAISGAAFSIAGASFPVSLAPGNKLDLQVQFVPTGAGGATGQITVNSNSTSSPVTTLALAGSGANAAPDTGDPRLTVSPAALSFGDVTMGNPTSQAVTLLSSGTAAVEVTSATVVGAGFSIDDTIFPITLNPNQQISLPVQFNPAATGTIHGDISFNSNSLDGAATVSLAANGVAHLTPQLSVGPGAVSFGDVMIGSPVTRNVTLTSTGSAAVTVSSVGIEGTGFTVSGSSFPVTLNPGAQATLQVQFNPTVTGAATGQITVNSTSSGNPVVGVMLSGTGAEEPNPQLAVATGAVSFGLVKIGRPTTQTVTLTSTGTSAVTVNSAAISGASFTVSGSSFPVTLDPGQLLTLDVQFKPTTIGTATGQLTVNSTSSGNPVSIVTLSGTGTTLPVPKLSIASSSGAFGPVSPGNRTTQSVTLTSTGTAPVTVNSATISGAGFTVSGSAFPAKLNPGQQFTLDVQFNPATVGAGTGLLTVNSTSANNSTASIPLSGTAATSSSRILTVSPTSVTFSSVTIGWPGTRNVTLTSTGTSSVTVNSATIAGTGFTVSGSKFPVTLNPKQAVTLQVKFNPTVAGTSTGKLTIKTTSSSNPTVVVGLTGTGATASSRVLTVSPTSLSFGSVTIGSSGTQNVTLTSTGTSSVTVSSAAIVGTGFTVSGSSFPVTLNPKQVVTLQVKFNPTVAGAATGQLTVKSTSSSKPTAVVSLTGTGATTTVQHQVSLAWSAPSNSTQPVVGYRVYRATGSSTSYTLLNSTLDASVSYVDRAVQSGQSYTYYVTSVNRSGVESVASSKAKATVP
jgi:Abnormal spindle-like microcephaly-assoc'd, ASPM-SPD-2-Hydin